MVDKNDDFLDGCSINMDTDPTSDEEVELLPLFAEALDPNSSTTIEDVEKMWNDINAL